MNHPRTAKQILDRDFLEVRGKVLELAAALDRLDLGLDRETIGEDPRWIQLIEALRMLGSPDGDRAEQVQLIFSDPYQTGWLDTMAPAFRR